MHTTTLDDVQHIIVSPFGYFDTRCQQQKEHTHMELVPSSFRGTLVLPERELPTRIEPGTLQGVHFTVPAQQRADILAKIARWFDDRDEVILVATGVSSKQELGYIILEWDGCEVDPLFLAILRDEEAVDDFSVYTRSEED